MKDLSEKGGQTSGESIELMDLGRAIVEFYKNPFETLEKIHAYNEKNIDKKIMLIGMGSDAAFIRHCSDMLNKLLETDRKRAKILNKKFKDILDGTGNAIFRAWCDVDAILSTKKRKKR